MHECKKIRFYNILTDNTKIYYKYDAACNQIEVACQALE
jgi:hypothetical protein